MNYRTMLIIASFLTIFVLLNAFVGWSGLLFWRSSVTPDADWVYGILYAAVAGSYLLSALLRRVLPYPVRELLKRIGSYGFGVLFYAFIGLPFAYAAYWAMRWSGVQPDRAVSAVGWTLLAVMGVLLLWGFRNAWSPVVRRYELTVDKRAGAYRELRIAVASDLHLGSVVGRGHLMRLIRNMEMLKPDLILLPGDVLDDSIEPFVRKNMGELMGRLGAPLGVYVCLGNHEYIGGHIDEYVERMKRIGIEVLADRTVKVADSFYIAGRKDAAVERFARESRLSLPELLAGKDMTLPILVLDHQPRELAKAAEAGVDLMLSGHTHRGQMMPNHLLTRRLFELDWGYLKKGSMHAVVSSGFGTWGPPVRIGSRSELLDIRLSFEPPV